MSQFYPILEYSQCRKSTKKSIVFSNELGFLKRLLNRHQTYKVQRSAYLTNLNEWLIKIGELSRPL